MGSVNTSAPRQVPSFRGEMDRIDAERERDRRERRDPIVPPSILVYVQPDEPPASAPVGTLWLDTSVEV
jgi:hypothetical protein